MVLQIGVFVVDFTHGIEYYLADSRFPVAYTVIGLFVYLFVLFDCDFFLAVIDSIYGISRLLAIVSDVGCP